MPNIYRLTGFVFKQSGKNLGKMHVSWRYLQSESSKSLFKTGSRHSLEKVAVVVFFAVSDAVFSMAGIPPWHL